MVVHSVEMITVSLLHIVSAAKIPIVTLNNGVQMPSFLLGMGPWCNHSNGHMGDCYNRSQARQDVLLAFSLGIVGIDTAKGYGEYGANTGIAEAVAVHPRNETFLQSKVNVQY